LRTSKWAPLQSRPSECEASGLLRRFPFLSLYAAKRAPSKGRLIRCTVPGSTPKRFAILRTPSVRPGALRAAGIFASSSGAIRGRPSCLPSALARLRPARTRSWMIERCGKSFLAVLQTGERSLELCEAIGQRAGRRLDSRKTLGHAVSSSFDLASLISQSRLPANADYRSLHRTSRSLGPIFFEPPRRWRRWILDLDPVSRAASAVRVEAI
jgi:hypothetical protein